MQPCLRIRLATEDDALAIGVLVRRCTRRDVLPDQTAAAGAHLMATMTARAERELIRAGRRYHLAEIDGHLVGVVATRDDTHIFRLFVSHRFRRRGIARALLRKALADCQRRSGTRKFTLNASAYAVPAYLRLGFVAAGRLLARGPHRVVAAPMVYKAGRHPTLGTGKSPSRRSRA
jgi:GNAT superfamily N-acetyltransferase